MTKKNILRNHINSGSAIRFRNRLIGHSFVDKKSPSRGGLGKIRKLFETAVNAPVNAPGPFLNALKLSEMVKCLRHQNTSKIGFSDIITARFSQNKNPPTPIKHRNTNISHDSPYHAKFSFFPIKATEAKLNV